MEGLLLSYLNPDFLTRQNRLTASWSLSSFAEVAVIVSVYLVISILAPLALRRKRCQHIQPDTGACTEHEEGSHAQVKAAAVASACGGVGQLSLPSRGEPQNGDESPTTRSSSVSNGATGRAGDPPDGAEPTKCSRDVPLDRFRREPVLLLQSIYDVVQIVLSGYVGMLGVSSLLKSLPHCPLIIWCERGSFDLAAKESACAVAWHAFYWLKVADLADTLFIIARQKWQQLSFLHVYHHASMLLFCWVMLNAGFADDIIIGQIANCFVHVLMYFYYLLRGMGVRIPRYLKSCLTTVQMAQFVLLSGHSLLGMLFAFDVIPFTPPVPSCPPRLMLLETLYQMTMYILFQDFSRTAYKSSKATKEA
ncbi:unnamed protein product [Vitrella brassicaformis CCMP3155]|uniref:Elongation of fatty acids protein n=2 Tax=Vitrella brassicaformis TaxID=1169539 RepID=A0A0G4H010_VITBC|nr:unnamed protein product [Vitrella brassicaformis CCMP3155]|mmetsp:Transcript_38008/g.95228  ORF Transcript_38008/g.95228 Transcript_38008/m.95228 type:complete len:364 (+) Transcript_38008:59-1150(+)|eukprot:CEM36827.1 unnamed protein product [Vitrella brassicaformis CCMP3155]